MGIPPKRKVVWEVGSVPWRNLTANKMRTFLTVLGIAVGIATGFYPAKRAGRLNPLDALRYE